MNYYSQYNHRKKGLPFSNDYYTYMFLLNSRAFLCEPAKLLALPPFSSWRNAGATTIKRLPQTTYALCLRLYIRQEKLYSRALKRKIISSLPAFVAMRAAWLTMK
jgi:hypothetical protein